MAGWIESYPSPRGWRRAAVLLVPCPQNPRRCPCGCWNAWGLQHSALDPLGGQEVFAVPQPSLVSGPAWGWAGPGPGGETAAQAPPEAPRAVELLELRCWLLRGCP